MEKSLNIVKAQVNHHPMIHHVQLCLASAQVIVTPNGPGSVTLFHDFIFC